MNCSWRQGAIRLLREAIDGSYGGLAAGPWPGRPARMVAHAPRREGAVVRATVEHRAARCAAVRAQSRVREPTPKGCHVRCAFPATPVFHWKMIFDPLTTGMSPLADH
jgi:hypothetical protein